MKKGTTTFGLAPERVQRLFDIGRDVRNVDGRLGRNERKARMLRSRLMEPLPLDESQIGMLPAVLGQLCHTIGLLAGETVLALLQDASTDISLIERIKRYGKELSAGAESKAEDEVATTIYYAAIASALAYHDVRITKFSYKKLETFFSRLAKEKWVSKDLSGLFKIARKCCKGRARQ